ncbi:uncharacterized protein TNCV_2650081 [Trichonephila clavipes]|nr:uncharacterized protein TNCV_2650081 [Trichonephila clavipes]
MLSAPVQRELRTPHMRGGGSETLLFYVTSYNGFLLQSSCNSDDSFMVLHFFTNGRVIVQHLIQKEKCDQGIGSGWLAPSSSPVPLKTRRVGKRCKLNLSRAQASSLWCSVVGRREGVPAQVSSSSLDHGWFKMMRSVAKNLRVAEQCDVNNNSSSRWRGMATWRGDTSSDVVLVT